LRVEALTVATVTLVYLILDTVFVVLAKAVSKLRVVASKTITAEVVKERILKIVVG